MAILCLATPRYDGNAQFTQKIRLCLMAIIYRKRLLMAMLSFDKIETNDGNVQSDGNDQFRQKETSDGNAQFRQKESADGNAQFQPTCPIVSQSANSRVRSYQPKFVSHLMAMLSFRRHVLQ